MAIYSKRKDDLESELNRNAVWAIVYGDLMSYLMIFFLMMFTTNLTAPAQKSRKTDERLMKIVTVFGGEVSEETQARDSQRKQEDNVLSILKTSSKEGEFGKDSSLIVTEDKIELNLGAGILFASGEAVLKEDAKEILKKYVAGIANVKNEIHVEGHTDSVRIGKGLRYRSNWELSMARAYSVIAALEALGVEPQRLSGVGYGEYRPIADNSTPEGQAQNRRITVSISRTR